MGINIDKKKIPLVYWLKCMGKIYFTFVARVTDKY